MGENKITIRSRNGNLLNDIYPELLSIKDLFNKKVILDGEIVAFDDGKPSFKLLQKRFRLKNKTKISELSKKMKVVFICFDIIYENKDITNLPLIKRKEILNKYKDSTNFIKTKYIIENGKDLFKLAKSKGLEGIVAKEINSIYEIGKRVNTWIKIKNIQDDDFYICGYRENKNNTSTLLLSRSNKSINPCGKVLINRSNKDYERILSIKKLSKTLEKDFIIINPILKCTVYYTEKTGNNSLRHAVFKCIK